MWESLLRFSRYFFLRMFRKCQFSKKNILWKSYEKIILKNKEAFKIRCVFLSWIIPMLSSIYASKQIVAIANSVNLIKIALITILKIVCKWTILKDAQKFALPSFYLPWLGFQARYILRLLVIKNDINYYIISVIPSYKIVS